MSSAPLHRNPAWFGSVMATSALSIAFLQQSDYVGGATFVALADGLLVLATLLALGLAPLYLVRARNRKALATEIADPAQGAMLATFPAGILVYASAWGTVGAGWLGTGIALTVCAVLLVIGAGLGIALSVAWASLQSGVQLDLVDVNGGWLIPVVMNLIAPLSIASLIEAYPSQATWLLIIGLAFFGVGTLLFLPMFALLVARLALRPPVPNTMQPTLWIPLAPAGLIGLALLRLMQAGAEAGILSEEAIALGIVVSAMGIGLGLWWSLYAAGRLIRVRRAGGLPFLPGWWGFVFPVAALSLSFGALADQLGSAPVDVASFAVFVCLVIAWAIVAWRSSAAVLRAMRPA
jgi:C4-dicarboxylate transporter/malic acid transport protein